MAKGLGFARVGLGFRECLRGLAIQSPLSRWNMAEYGFGYVIIGPPYIYPILYLLKGTTYLDMVPVKGYRGYAESL